MTKFFPLLRLGVCMVMSGAISAQAAWAQVSITADLSEALQAADSCVLAPRTHALRLSDAVNFALCNSPQTAAGWARIRGQAADLAAAKAAYLPTLNLTATNQWGHSVETAASDIPVFDSNVRYATPVATADLSLVLFDFGLRAHNLQSAQEHLIADRALQEDTLHSVVVAVAQAYFDLVNAQEALTAAEQAETSAAETLESSKARVAAGTAVRVDVLQAQTSYSQTVVKRVTAEGDLAVKRGTLATAMGLSVNTPLAVETPDPTSTDAPLMESVEQLLEDAELHNPKVLAARAQVRAAEEDVGSIEAQGRPTVSVDASYRMSRVTYSQDSVHAINQIPADTHDRDASVMLKVTIPIFEGFTRTFNIRSARAKAESATADLQNAVQQAMLDVWTADRSLHAAILDIGASSDLLKSATESFQATQGRYIAGVGTVLDVLSAQNALEDARKTRIQAYSTWHMAKLKLAIAVGNISFRDVD